MLYSVANLHEIGFIARVHARISRWILVFVTLYVWRVAFLFVRAISARTEILNRSTRKCQSRRRHVRLQRVPPLVLPTSRRDATRHDGNGEVRQKLNGKKRGRIVSKLSFCWLECHPHAALRSNRVKNGVFYFTWLVAHVYRLFFNLHGALVDRSGRIDRIGLYLIILAHS